MQVADIEEIEDLEDDDGVDDHGPRRLYRQAAAEGVEEDPDGSEGEESGHEEDSPNQEGRQQGGARGARRACHDARLGRLEGENEPEGDRGNEVDPEDLRRRHRHGEANQDRGGHGHRLAAIGRHGPGDDLADIVEDRPPLVDGRCDRDEIVVEQHHLGGLLRGLRPLPAHGDADVGLLQRRRVVDAVAGHGDDRARRLQRADDLQLVGRVGAGEDGRVADERHQLCFGRTVEFGTDDDPIPVAQPELPGDGAGRHAMVTGDHLDRDAGGAAFRDGLDDLLARRIDEADDTEEDQPLVEIGEGQDARCRAPPRRKS